MSLPTRIQEEINIFNLALHQEQIIKYSEEPSKENQAKDEYEPALEELLRTVECHVCRCIPVPPLYNCENGHFTCNSCRPRLPSMKCGYCMANFTKMRNYPLENLVTAKLLTCDFWKDGCKEKAMTMARYEDHVKSCAFNQNRTKRKAKAPPVDRVLRVKNQNVILSNADNEPTNQPCPRCTFRNSIRKLKCHNCQLNLRIPTPMCGRHVLGSSENPIYPTINNFR